jgi:hypothetical protein
MNENNMLLDVVDREKDYKELMEMALRAEKGLRAISVMYDEHSNDKNSASNIFLLKENIQYRINSAVHQYLILLKELRDAEAYLQVTHQKNPQYFNAFLFGNPFFEKVEMELSSVFDGIIFQVSSIFDYLSHVICYISFRNKSKTVYWTKLAKASRGQNNDFENEVLRKTVDDLDRKFIGRLYDYRSRLLHNKRDKHQFGGQARRTDFKFTLQLKPSEFALAHFNSIKDSLHQNTSITLTYLASQILRQIFAELETVLDSMASEIRKNSFFGNNLFNPKKGMDALLIVSVNPETHRAEPISNSLWDEYKKKTES